MKIGIIGAGVMGSAMVKAFEEHELFVCDRSLEKIKSLGIKNGFTDPEKMISQVDVVIFAVRPQNFKALAESIKIDMADKIIVSVMAGITIAQLQVAIGSKAIIRCMPNLAMNVGKGVIALTITDAIDDDFKRFIEDSFSRLGIIIEIEEEQIDAIIAISGSGLAYFFALAEALTEAAKKMGIPTKQARLLAENTLVGSGQLMALENKSAGELKREIMVRGGTTEAGIRELEKQGFDKIIMRVAEVVQKRAKELSI